MAKQALCSTVLFPALQFQSHQGELVVVAVEGKVGRILWLWMFRLWENLSHEKKTKKRTEIAPLLAVVEFLLLAVPLVLEAVVQQKQL